MRDSFRPSRGGALIWDGSKYVQETEYVQTYEDYLSDEPNAYGIPDGLTREEYAAAYVVKD